jgi:photosystem II stability/assembly factor-like uncharacterized protein
VLPIRSEEEFKQGKLGGEAEQHLHGICRSLSNPDVIYWSQDVAGPWNSTDGGKTWRKTVSRGLYTANGLSIEVDPVDSDIVLTIVANLWNRENRTFEGLYRSKDGGENWELVLQTSVNMNWDKHRTYQHNVAYDLASRTPSGAKTWYAAFVKNGLYRSDDFGNTWVKAAGLEEHQTVYCIQAHPKDGQTVYLASSIGLFVSRSRGTNLQRVEKLPPGPVTSVAVNPLDPNVVYATIMYPAWNQWSAYSLGDPVFYAGKYYTSAIEKNRGCQPDISPTQWKALSTSRGLYKSTDGGATFKLLKEHDAWQVFINPGHPKTLYLAGFSNTHWTKSPTIISHDDGSTWNEYVTVTPAPGFGRDRYTKKLTGDNTGIVPNPNDPCEAVVFTESHIYKTTNGGRNFVESSSLFTGYAVWLNSGFAFDKYNPNRFVFFLCDVAMVVTDNGGDSFRKYGHTVDGKTIWDWKQKGLIPWIGAYSGSLYPARDSQIMIATIGNYPVSQPAVKLMRSESEAKGWQLVTDTKDRILHVYFHQSDPNVVYAGTRISHDAGKTFTPVNFGQLAKPPSEIMGMCLAKPDTVYAIGRFNTAILRSDDRGETWRLYNSPQYDWKFIKSDPIPTFTVDPVDPDKVYTIDKQGDIAVFDGQRWKSLGLLSLIDKPANMSIFVRNIAIDPRHPEVIYAAVNCPGISNIWRSTDAGATWQDISRNLPRKGAYPIAVNPHTGELFAGGACGTYVLPPPYKSKTLVYDKCVSLPSEKPAKPAPSAGPSPDSSSK